MRRGGNRKEAKKLRTKKLRSKKQPDPKSPWRNCGAAGKSFGPFVCQGKLKTVIAVGTRPLHERVGATRARLQFGGAGGLDLVGLGVG